VDITLDMAEAAHEHPPTKVTRLQWAAIALGAVAVGLLIYGSLAGHDAEHHGSGHAVHAHAPSMWSIIPFAGLLLAIAILPLIHATEHWWEQQEPPGSGAEFWCRHVDILLARIRR